MAIISGFSGVMSNVSAGSKGIYLLPTDSLGKLLSGPKDILAFTALNFTPNATGALLPFTFTRNGIQCTTSAGTSSFTIPTGKMFIPLGMSACVRNAGLAVQGVSVAFAYCLSGPITLLAGATQLVSTGAGTIQAIANNVSCGAIDLDSLYGIPFGLVGDGLLSIGFVDYGIAAAGCDFSMWGLEIQV